MAKGIGNDEGIQYICKLIYEAYRVPVLWLDEATAPRLAMEPPVADRPSVQGTGGLPVEVMELVRGTEERQRAGRSMWRRTSRIVRLAARQQLKAGRSTR